MNRKWCFFAFLVWFSYILVSSILLFTNGFLLTREAQVENSTCISYKNLPCTLDDPMKNGKCEEEDKILSVFNHMSSALNICLPMKMKVVLLIVDALRYDFTLYNASLQNELPYQNKLPIINNLLEREPDNARLFEFIADPPTTTMQRLKALTTGSLPTFIDVGSNFATSEINEDNIIDQLIKENHKIVFMGDDTWTGLYPNHFKRSFPYPSFNVWDLDTVDNGVQMNLYPELKKDDWTLLIGHFLGVDHCGHRFGPNHPEMARKLTEINEVITKVSSKLKEDMMLIVIGDHGMTSNGDHGGESPDEVKSALFIYSKKPFISLPQDVSKQSSIKQIDLIPTLSAILGIPIPYSNLGSTVLSALPLFEFTSRKVPDWKLGLFAVWSNVQQLTFYIKEYSKKSNIFNSEKLIDFHHRYSILYARVHTISTDLEFKNFLNDALMYMSDLREMCESVWVQFDSVSMTRGLLLFFCNLFFVYLIVDGVPSEKIPKIFTGSFLLFSFISILIALFSSFVAFFMNFVNNIFLNFYFSSGLLSLVLLVFVTIQNWESIALNMYSKGKRRSWSKFLCRIVLVMSICILFSNSFIVEEGKVLMFLLISLVFIIVFDVPKQRTIKKRTEKITFSSLRKTPKAKALVLAAIVCVLIRMSTNFFRCREEQQWCTSGTHNILKSGFIYDKAKWALGLVSLGLMVIFSRMWLRNCGNLVGNSPSVIFARYTPTVLVVCTGGFWILHKLPVSVKIEGPRQADMLAWVVYSFIAVSLTIMALKPLCIYIVSRGPTLDINEENAVPMVFKQVKEMLNERSTTENNVPIVCGLATAYSSCFVIITIYFVILLSLLLGDTIAPSAVLMCFTAALILVISSISRCEKSTKIEQVFEVSTSSILIWFILALFYFYGTGHQATFPNIAWEAAFVGTGGNFIHNAIPATLVIINTFGSQIIMGLTLPLIIIAPSTLYVMLPWLYSKNNELCNDLIRGDMILYENEKNVNTQLFLLCCKYILCHAIRVFASMLTATIHCRHLMVWAIFAPKLIFESIGLMITLFSVCLGYLLFVRVNSEVDILLKNLNKKVR